MKFEDAEMFGWKLLDSCIKVMINLAITYPIYLALVRAFNLNMVWGLGAFFLTSIVVGNIIMHRIKGNLGLKIRQWMFYRK